MGEWIFSPGSDLSSSQVREGLAALDADLAGGPQKPISAAILELLGATDRPPQLSDAEAVARQAALKQMAWDYPLDVIQLACRRWRTVPSKGRWWPTEQDLRAQCEPLFEPRRSLRNKARALLQQLEAAEDHAERSAANTSAFAGDRQRRFRAEMEKRFNDRTRYEAYFATSQMDYEGDDTIIVRTAIAESVLTREGGDLLKRLGLNVRYAAEHFAGVKQPLWEHDSDEDRAEVARKFEILKLGIGGLA